MSSVLSARTNKIKISAAFFLFPLTLCLLIFLIQYAALSASYDSESLLRGIYRLMDCFPRLEPWLKDSLTTPVPNVSYALFLSSIGYSLDWLPWVFLAAVLWLGIAFLLGSSIIRATVGAQKLKGKIAVKRALEEISQTLQIKTPSLHVIPDTACNVLTTGRSLFLTQGMLDALTPGELRVVLANEALRIKERDASLTTLLVIGVGIFGLMGDALKSKLSSDGACSECKYRKNFLHLFVLLLAALNMLVASAPFLLLFNSSDFQADSETTRLFGDRKMLMSALQKVNGNGWMAALERQPSLSLLCFGVPTIRFKIASHSLEMASSRPSLKRRMDALP